MNRRSSILAGAAVLLLLVSCGNDSLGKVGLYDRAPVPFVPDRTEPITTAPDPLTDGYYWAELMGSADPGVLSFELTQVFFAAACEEQFGVDACSQGFAVVAEGARLTGVAAVDLSVVSVVAESRQNYAITGAELGRLVAGEPPASDAPDTYEYRPYPFLVSVTDGKVAEVHQIWLP